MRAVLTSFGTTGDILPLCSLALELRRHGHQVATMFPRHVAPLALDLGLDCTSYGPEVTDIHREILKQITGPSTPEALSACFVQLGRAMPRAFSDLAVLCRGADVLLSTTELPNLPPLGLMIHETTGIPFVSVHPDYPNYDDRSYVIEGLAALNHFRGFLGLPPLRLNGPEQPTVGSPQLALFELSRHILTPHPGWPAHYHVTGFFYHVDEAWEPDAALADFMDAGPPPVVITFGSVVHEDPQALSDLLVESVERVGCRAILQTGWSGLTSRQLPPSIHPIGFAQYSWLLPRAACVVHHGGSGTSGCVYRAGVPAVVVPHYGDQFALADRTHELDLSVRPIPYKELTAEGLSAAIKEVLTDPRYRAAASAFRDKVLEEDGVRTGRLLIEELVASEGR